MVVLLALAPLIPGLAQTPRPVGQGEPLMSSRFAWTVGAALLVSAWLDTSVREEALAMQGAWSDRAASVAKIFGEGQYVFPVLGLSYAAGRVSGLKPLAEVSGHALLATASAGIATVALKTLIGRERPYVSGSPSRFQPFDFKFKNESFPSGHTAMAFALATTFAAETPDRLSDVFFYFGATMTGLSRIHDDRHWLTDVVAGAGVGYLAGRWATRAHRRIPLSAGPGGVMLQLTF
ncbi:MAG: phosphatase PAP2 family protein [Gemmatimonadota bacterium]